MNVNDFCKTYLHKEINGWSQSGGQCVDQVRKYIQQVFGVKGNTFDWIAPGNAKDFFHNANPAHFDKIPNTPNAFPSEGDIVVFDHGFYGHVAIAWRECSDTNLFTFDQNWSEPRRCTFETHSYTRDKVIGWLRKR